MHDIHATRPRLGTELPAACGARARPDILAVSGAGMEGLFMPYDHRRQIANQPGDESTLDLLHALNRLSCNHSCTVGSGGASVGYLAHGTATDYMYQELHVPVAMTWEIYGDDRADARDCFRMFNPTTAAGFEKTVRQWSLAIMRLLLLLAQHPALAHLQLPQAQHSAAQVNAWPRQQQGQAHDAPTHMRVNRTQVTKPTNGRETVIQHDALGVTQSGVRHVQPFEVYNPMRSLLAGLLFFLATVVVWCAARRLLGNGKKRRRTGNGVKSKEGSSRQK